MNTVRRAGEDPSKYPFLLICTAAFVYYQLLIQRSPALYWYDAHVRVASHDQLLLGHWLPLLQAFIMLISRFTLDLAILRSCLSVLAVGALAGMYLLARKYFVPRVALLATTCLAANMMFAALAIVPYTETLFAGLIFFSLLLLDEPVFSRRFYLGAACLVLASLTRYEAWLLAGIFLAEYWVRAFRALHWRAALQQSVRIAALFSFGPVAWLGFGFPRSAGLLDRLQNIVAFEVMTAPPGVPGHILARLNPEHLARFSEQFVHLLTWQMGLEFLLLGVIGLLLTLASASPRWPHLRIVVFLAVDWCLLAFVQPWGFGNLRQPFLWLVFLIMYAAYGLDRLLSLVVERLGRSLEPLSVSRWTTITVCVVSLLLVAPLAPRTIEFVAESSREPDFFIPHEVGGWLASRVTPDDAILALTDSYGRAYILAAYIRLPLERILDDRLEPRFVQNELARAESVYVVELYGSVDGLSASELDLLANLESGHIPAERVSVGGTSIWLTRSDELAVSP